MNRLCDEMSCLERYVRHQAPHLLQPLPRALVQESHGDVEGGAAPVLQRVERAEVVRQEGADLEHVIGPHPGGQQRLVGVAKSCVRQQEALGVKNSLGEALRTVLKKHVPQSRGRGLA